MPEFVQEGGYPLGAGRETGADADEAVGLGSEKPEDRADAGADPEVRDAVDAGAGRQVGGVEEARLAEGQQVLPQLRIRQWKHGGCVDIRFRDGLVGHYLAFERSKPDVVRHRDVIRERRIEDVDGGLLISEEAVDLRLGERPIGIEVVVDRDLHGVFLRSLIGAATRATRIAGFRGMVSHRTLSECDVHHIFSQFHSSTSRPGARPRYKLPTWPTWRQAGPHAC
jgi:hypothetical protein